MPKGASSSSAIAKQVALEKTEKVFYFLEGAGTLLWVLGDFTWLMEIETVFNIMYVLAVLANFAALGYAFLKLRHTIPIIPIIAYNLWVIMGCLWTFAEANESNEILLITKVIGSAMLLLTVFEFTVNRNNQENVFSFIKSFRKYRIRESSGLSITDVLSLPDDQFDLIKWMVKQGRIDLAEAAAFLKQDEAECQKTLESLVKQGFIRAIESGGKTSYKVRLDPRRGLQMPDDLWETSEEPESGK